MITFNKYVTALMMSLRVSVSYNHLELAISTVY